MTAKNYLEFIYEMTMREFKARYKKAIFGFLWVILNPLLEMVIIGTVFSIFIDIPNYYLFLFAGLLPWQFFSLSVNKATPSFEHQRYLLKKSAFPKLAIPFSIIFANCINFLIALTLFIGYLLITSQGKINLLILTVGITWLLILTSGISFITAPINTRFRDINFFTQTSLILVFYATPILYASSNLPLHLQNIPAFNPLTSPLELIRFGLIGGTINDSFFLPNLLTTFFLIGIALFTYAKMHKFMVDWL